jgi:parvulin-like peptidyl-prolyl isomerase
MKHFNRWVAAAATLVAASAVAELVDRIAAVVNNEIITLSELEKRAAPELARIGSDREAQSRAAAHNKILHQVLDSMIGEKLVDLQLKEANIEVTDAEVDAAVENIKTQNHFDNEKLEQALKQEGLSMAKWRSEVLKKQLARFKLMRSKTEAKVKVSNDDVRSEYTRWAKLEAGDAEIHARHILVRVEENASPEQIESARRRAEKIVEEARKAGGDFAELARRKGEGATAKEGGDLGFFRRGVMFQEFEKVAFALKPGEVSDPVRTQFGWHVIKVEERRPIPVKSLSEMEPFLKEKLRATQLEKLNDAYIQELKQGAVVEVKI